MGGEWGEKGRGGPIKIVGERFHRGFRIDCNVFSGIGQFCRFFFFVFGLAPILALFSQPIQMQ
jgi:hypothetical protein